MFRAQRLWYFLLHLGLLLDSLPESVQDALERELFHRHLYSRTTEFDLSPTFRLRRNYSFTAPHKWQRPRPRCTKAAVINTPKRIVNRLQTRQLTHSAACPLYIAKESCFPAIRLFVWYELLFKRSLYDNSLLLHLGISPYPLPTTPAAQRHPKVVRSAPEIETKKGKFIRLLRLFSIFTGRTRLKESMKREAPDTL